jgi:hypothetical protein
MRKRFTTEYSAVECIINTTIQTIEKYAVKNPETLKALSELKKVDNLNDLFVPNIMEVMKNLRPNSNQDTTTCLGNRKSLARWTVVEEETDETINPVDLEFSINETNKQTTYGNQLAEVLENSTVSNFQMVVNEPNDNTTLPWITTTRLRNRQPYATVNCEFIFNNPNDASIFRDVVFRKFS